MPAIPKLLSVTCLVFDVDDTLVYTYRNGFEKVNAAAEQLGLPKLDEGAFDRAYGSLTFDECVRVWFPGIDVQAFAAAYDRAAERFPYCAIADFGALQQRASARGVRVGVLSNGMRDKTRRKLEASRARPEALAFILAREDLPAAKPSPSAFEPVIAATRLAPGCHAYVGDSRADRHAALGAGLEFVAVNTGPRPWQAGETDIIIDDFARVLDLL